MLAKCIFILVHCICFVSFLIAGQTGSDTYPISFWSGGNEKLAGILKDIPSYNREMKQVFTAYAFLYLIGAVLSAFSIESGIFLLLAGCTVGIALVGCLYRKIRKKYS